MQAMAEPHDQPHVMVDDEQTQAARDRQGGQRMQQRLGLSLVHTRRRLIEQEEGGVGGEGAGNLDAPFVAVAQRAAQFIRPGRQPELAK